MRAKWKTIFTIICFTLIYFIFDYLDFVSWLGLSPSAVIGYLAILCSIAIAYMGYIIGEYYFEHEKIKSILDIEDKLILKPVIYNNFDHKFSKSIFVETASFNFIFFTDAKQDKLFFQKDLFDNYLSQNRRELEKTIEDLKAVKSSNFFLKKEITQAINSVNNEMSVLTKFEEHIMNELKSLSAKRATISKEQIDFNFFYSKYPLTKVFNGMLNNNYEVNSFNLISYDKYRKSILTLKT